MSEEPKSDLKSAIKQIEKQFGEGAIMTMGGERANALAIEGISTGAISLDIALGGKGLPRGRVIEVYGPESGGKTTLTLHAIANAQKAGGVAAFIDAEHALDPSWAKRLGVDLEGLLVSQPSSAEEALKIAEMLIRSNAVDIIVIDSVAALVPRAEVEGEIGDAHVGVQARLMSQALRILNPLVAKTKTCLVFINQIRQKIGVMYGNPETTSGGLALKFFASVRLEIRKTGQVKEKDDVIGSEVRVKVVKNKVAPPFQQAEFALMYDRGIAREADLFSQAKKDGIFEGRGSWVNYGELRFQGEKQAIQYLRDNPALMDEVSKKILDKHGLAGADPASNGEAKEETPEAAPAPTGSRKRQAAAAPSES
jgi:recombination protein RecA